MYNIGKTFITNSYSGDKSWVKVGHSEKVKKWFEKREWLAGQVLLGVQVQWHLSINWDLATSGSLVIPTRAVLVAWWGWEPVGKGLKRMGGNNACPSTDDWINKVWYIYAVEYYSTMKRNEVLIHAPTYINLENITVSERNQSQRTTCCRIPFI